MLLTLPPAYGCLRVPNGRVLHRNGSICKLAVMRLTGNKILITGGGSGIGYAMAERFDQEGNTVIICGRRESALSEAKEKLPSIITRQCDLANEDERVDLYEWIAK